MYDQYVNGYAAIMARHDCSQIRSAIQQAIVSAGATAASAERHRWRIADLGCGTGRGTKLVCDAINSIRHASSSSSSKTQNVIFNVCGVDKAAAMVKEFEKEVKNYVSSRGDGSDDSTVVVVLPRVAATGDEQGDAASSSSASTIWSSPGSLEEFLTLDPHAPPSAANRPTLVPLRPSPAVDVVICAWALSHVMSAQWGGDKWHATVLRCVRSMEALIDTTTTQAGGLVIIVETLGTDTETPTRRSTLHDFLEKQCGFAPPVVVRTDYRFQSREEGEKMVRFFFGEEMRQRFAKKFEANANAAPVLAECTGVWIKRVSGAAAPAAAPAAAAAESTETKEAPQRRERGE